MNVRDASNRLMGRMRYATSPSPAVSYDADAQAYFDQTDGSANELTATRKGYINTFIVGLKADGIYTQMDAMWLLANQNETAASYALVENGGGNTGGVFTLSVVNSPTFTQDRGYTGNGTTQYIDTQYIPSGGSLVTQNSASIGVYSRTNVDEGSVDMGSNDSKYFYMRSKSGVQISALMDAIGEVGTVTTSLGLMVGMRTASNAWTNYQNGASTGTGATASSGVPTFSTYILGTNNNGTASDFSTRQIAFAFMGSGTINQAALYTRVQTLMTSLGANV